MTPLILCVVWLVLIPFFVGVFKIIDDPATAATAGVFWPAALVLVFVFMVVEIVADGVRWVYRLGLRIGKWFDR